MRNRRDTQRQGRRHVGEEIGIRDHVLLLACAVEARRGKRVRQRETIVEHAEAGPHHRLRAPAAPGALGRPRQGKTRSDIAPVVQVRLRLIANSETQREVRARAPLVAREDTNIYLAQRQLCRAGSDAELCGAAAQSAAQAQQRAPVALDGTDRRQKRLARPIEHRLVSRVQHRLQIAASEGKRPRKVLRGQVVIPLVPHAHPEAPGMRAAQHRRVVLKLEVTLRIERLGGWRSAPVECAEHLDLRARAVRGRMVGISVVLKTDVVHGGAGDRGFGHLHRLDVVPGMVAARHHVETADAGIMDISAGGSESRRQSVVGTQRVIHARADLGEALRRGDHGAEGTRGQSLRIECDAVRNRTVVHHVVLCVHREGCPFAERPTAAAFEFVQQKRGLFGGVRIARIPNLGPEIIVDGRVVLVAARLGEDLDPPISQLVVLGRERVLVDADFTNGILGRQIPAAESIDVDRAAVGAGRRPGQSL